MSLARQAVFERSGSNCFFDIFRGYLGCRGLAHDMARGFLLLIRFAYVERLALREKRTFALFGFDMSAKYGVDGAEYTDKVALGRVKRMQMVVWGQ